MSDGTCPACGSATFGWAKSSPRPAYGPSRREQLIDRCESCGLGLAAGAPASLESALEGEVVSGPNRASLQAALGARGWAAIDPDRQIYPTPAAAEPIAARLGARTGKVRTPLAPASVWAMWQTLINAFTLRDNVISDAFAGRLAPRGGKERAGMALDLMVSALVAIPIFLVALILEGAASLLGRGGIARIELER